MQNEDQIVKNDSVIKNKPLVLNRSPSEAVDTLHSSETKKFSRHFSLPDISTNVKNQELSDDLKEIFGKKLGQSEFSSYGVIENSTEETIMPSKCLHSYLSDKSKSSTESSSASPSNEDIWHLADDGSETVLKHPLKFDLDGSINVTESDSCSNDLEKGSSSNSNLGTFSFWEAQRAYLESRIGIESLIKVYRLVADLEERSVDERLDYSDFQKILGRGNEDLIDNIIQLVIADNFFNIDQR